MNAVSKINKPLLSFPAHSAAIWSLTTNPVGNMVATASEDQTIGYWSIPSGRLVQRVDAHRGGVNAVSFSSDGTLLASGGEDGLIKWWTPTETTPRRVLPGHRGGVNAVCFANNGKYFASAGGIYRRPGQITVWKVPSGRQKCTFKGHNNEVLTAVFSPDSRTLATAGHDGAIRLWDVPNEAPLAVLHGHQGAVWSLAFSSDGQRLYSGGDDGMLRCWDAYEGHEIRHRSIDSFGVLSIVALPNDPGVIIGLYHGNLIYWDPLDPYVGHVIGEHCLPVFGLAVLPDGYNVVGGGMDGKVNLWHLGSSTVRHHMRPFALPEVADEKPAPELQPA